MLLDTCGSRGLSTVSTEIIPAGSWANMAHAAGTTQATATEDGGVVVTSVTDAIATEHGKATATEHCQDMLPAFKETCSTFPQEWGIVQPRFLEHWLTALYPNFVQMNPIFPKYNSSTGEGTRLDKMCKPMGPLKGIIFGKDTSAEEKEAARNELQQREAELESFIIKSLQETTEENAWDYGQDRAVSFCPQLIFHLCLMRNSKEDAYKLDFSNKEYSVEFLYLFHSETYGVGNYMACMKKIMSARKDIYCHAKLIEWKMACKMARAAEGKGLQLCTANHWAEDLLNDLFFDAVIAEARMCPPKIVASEFCEYVTQGVVDAMPAGEDYQEADLHALFDLRIAPRLCKLQEAGVIRCIDDLKNASIFPTDQDGAQWSAHVKCTKRAHINTNDFLKRREEFFDVVKSSMSTCIYGTSTGEETDSHRLCAFGFVYSDDKGFNTPSKIEASTGKYPCVGGREKGPTLADIRQACSDDIKQTWQMAAQKQKRFVCEGTCPLGAIVRTVGLLEALQFAGEQGGPLFETKVPISVLFTEHLQRLADAAAVSLPDLAAKELADGWEEMSLSDVKDLPKDVLEAIVAVIENQDILRQCKQEHVATCEKEKKAADALKESESLRILLQSTAPTSAFKTDTASTSTATEHSYRRIPKLVKTDPKAR